MYEYPNKYLENTNDFLNSLDNYEIVSKNTKLSKIEYINLSCSFDIETSSFMENNEKKSCMYCWQFGINGKAIIGRTWDSFISFYEELVKYFNLDYNRRLIVFVHDLQFEFQFIQHRLEWLNVFATEKRKVLKALTLEGIEFRCSYMLSGLSLEKTCESLNKYKSLKLVGNLDYDKVRNSKTVLTKEELDYAIFDVYGVMNYIQEQIEFYNNDISKIPLTNTGRVREYCREKCFSDYRHYSKLMNNLTISTDEYNQLSRAKAGGFSHANYRMSKKTQKNVASFDLTSAYATVMCAEKFPMSKSFFIEKPTKDEFYRLNKLYCTIFDIKFNDIYEKVEYENYISKSNCWGLEEVVENNGRIIGAKKLCTTITNVDFDIIEKLYEFDSFEVLNIRYYFPGYLPKEIIDSILGLYEKKTILKGISGKEEEYINTKSMLSSVYGCSITDIVRDEIKYKDGQWTSERGDKDSQISNYNNNKNRFLYYPWGIFTAAYNRRNLFLGICEFGKDYIYSDTDSLKVLNYENHERFIKEYNEWIVKKIEKTCDFYNIDKSRIYPKNIKGDIKPLGVWDYEGSYEKFKTIGSKRYISEKEGKITCTIAGVNKEKVSKWMNEIENPFENFDNFMTIPSDISGRLTITYLDDRIKGVVTDYNGVESQYDELSSIHMEKSDFNLVITPLYLALCGE